jgi:hypothetical protein
MSYFLIPAVFALIVKIMIFIFAAKTGLRNSLLFVFIVTYAIHNVWEITVLLSPYLSNDLSFFIMRIYYVTSFLLTGLACSLALRISEVPKSGYFKKLELVTWVSTSIGILLSLFSNMIITGVEPLTYSMTALRGPAYIFFAASCSLALIIGLTSLIIESLNSDSERQRKRTLGMLIAFTPMVVAAIGVILLMHYNYQINATMVLPITSTLFLVILTWSERKHRLTGLRHIIPFTHEFRVSNELRDTFNSFAANEISFTDANDKIQTLLLSYSYEKHKGNKKLIAKTLQIPRSTLYTKLDKYKIGIEDF